MNTSDIGIASECVGRMEALLGFMDYVFAEETPDGKTKATCPDREIYVGIRADKNGEDILKLLFPESGEIRFGVAIGFLDNLFDLEESVLVHMGVGCKKMRVKWDGLMAIARKAGPDLVASLAKEKRTFMQHADPPLLRSPASELR